MVAPLAGAWVEIDAHTCRHTRALTSLPSRERGLKFTTSSDVTAVSIVAPLAGAWVEIGTQVAQNLSIMVAPLAGAWVEIEYTVGLTLEYLSLPSRERGLKLSFE